MLTFSSLSRVMSNVFLSLYFRLARQSRAHQRCSPSTTRMATVEIVDIRIMFDIRWHRSRAYVFCSMKIVSLSGQSRQTSRLTVEQRQHIASFYAT
jgi:hypothetical protein